MKLADLGEAAEIGRADIPMAVGVEEPALSDTDEGSANTGVAASQHVYAMTQLLGKHYTSQCECGIEAELENFLREAPPPLDSTPTVWWKVNGKRFPRLAKLARRYLCITVTSVSSERVFSAAGLTVTRLVFWKEKKNEGQLCAPSCRLHCLGVQKDFIL